jgi:hypothetical protein
LGSIGAEILTWASDKFQLLLANQFGARPGRLTMDSLHLVVKQVRDEWRKGRVVGDLFLDTMSAFPHVNHKRLAHDMHCLGIPKELIDWYESLGVRHTVLTFDDYESN